MSDSDIQSTHDLSVQTDTTSDSASRPPDVAKVIRLDEPSRPRLGKDFLRLWGATAASNVGDGVRITALPLLAAFLTRNPVLISGVLIATRLPWLLFSLHAGAIVDRVDRRRLIVGVNIARGVVMGVLALSVATGIGGLAALYLVALLQGIGEVFSDNTSFAMLPSVVPKERLEDANGALEGAIIVTNEFAGPALGALLFAHWASVPFALDAATFVLAAWLFAGIKVTSTPREKSSTTVGDDIRTGLDWLRSHTLLRNLTVIASLTNLALQATFAIQVLFVLNTLGLSATGFGHVMAAEAGGSLIGSFAAAPMKRLLGTRATVVIALSVVAVANLVVA
ncbi:MAG: MFS transporter, partial [Actinobacteria bacterium]|nr:MFS transporter [Actinomycetota bacterium]